jgi:hypothetical protein
MDGAGQAKGLGLFCRWRCGFWGAPVFSDKTLAGVGVITPRHKCTWVLTIEEMLGFGRADLIGWREIFLSVFFSFSSWLMGHAVTPNILH